jgi:hypothetical protein
LIALSIAGFAQDKKKESRKEIAAGKDVAMAMKGYVVDLACAKDMIGKDDAMTKAANHTKKCALEEMCAASGYGLFSDGKWYKFDEAGDKLAKALIEKTTKKKEIAVEVTGKMGDGTMAVTSIKEQKTMKAEKKAEKKGKS